MSNKIYWSLRSVRPIFADTNQSRLYLMSGFHQSEFTSSQLQCVRAVIDVFQVRPLVDRHAFPAPQHLAPVPLFLAHSQVLVPRLHLVDHLMVVWILALKGIWEIVRGESVKRHAHVHSGIYLSNLWTHKVDVEIEVPHRCFPCLSATMHIVLYRFIVVVVVFLPIKPNWEKRTAAYSNGVSRTFSLFVWRAMWQLTVLLTWWYSRFLSGIAMIFTFSSFKHIIAVIP